MNIKTIIAIAISAAGSLGGAQLAGLFDTQAAGKLFAAAQEHSGGFDLPSTDSIRSGAEQIIAAGVSAAANAIVSSGDSTPRATAAKARICGRVSSVYDGDTLTMLTESGGKQKVRLAQIDAPEKRQAYGATSAAALTKLALNQDVCLKPAGKNGTFEASYDRTVAWVERKRDGLEINRAMVAQGHAHVGEARYLTDRSLLRDQAAAQAAGAGLWALPESQRIPPSEWRKANR